MQSYTPLVPITGINEEFCFCFLLVAGLILHFNGSCWEIMRAAADGAGAAAAAVGHGHSDSQPRLGQPSMVESHVPWAWVWRGRERREMVYAVHGRAVLGPSLGDGTGGRSPVELWDQQRLAPAAVLPELGPNLDKGWEAAELPPRSASRANADLRCGFSSLLLPQKKWLM